MNSLGTYEFQLKQRHQLTTVSCLPLQIVRGRLLSPTWSLLVLALWCTSTVHNFTDVSNLSYAAPALFVFLPAVVFGTTVLVTLTLFFGGEFCLFFNFTLFVLGREYSYPF